MKRFFRQFGPKGSSGASTLQSERQLTVLKKLRLPTFKSWQPRCQRKSLAAKTIFGSWHAGTRGIHTGFEISGSQNHLWQNSAKDKVWQLILPTFLLVKFLPSILFCNVSRSNSTDTPQSKKILTRAHKEGLTPAAGEENEASRRPRRRRWRHGSVPRRGVRGRERYSPRRTGRASTRAGRRTVASAPPATATTPGLVALGGWPPTAPTGSSCASLTPPTRSRPRWR